MLDFHFYSKFTLLPLLIKGPSDCLCCATSGCLLCPAWPRDTSGLWRSWKPCCAPGWANLCAELLSAGPVAHREMGKPVLRDSTVTARSPGCAASSQQEHCIIHRCTDSWCLQAELERARAGTGKAMKISSAISSGSGAKFNISCYNPVSSD